MEVGQVFAQLELAISKVCYAAWYSLERASKSLQEYGLSLAQF